jgi:hypothetical protein
MDHKPKLLDLVRNKIRLKHYSIRTERAYVDWIKRFILFHHKRHPASMGAPEIRTFLSHLAVERKVAASTQSQALSAIIFLYRDVLGRDVGSLGEVERNAYPWCSPVPKCALSSLGLMVNTGSWLAFSTGQDYV